MLEIFILHHKSLCRNHTSKMSNFEVFSDADCEKPTEHESVTGTHHGEELAVVVESENLDSYSGSSLAAKVDSCIERNGVVLISKSWCPFSKDAKEFLTEQMHVQVYVIEVDLVPQGSEILKIVQDKTGHKTVPVVFIKGRFVGGCDTIKALHEKGILEREYLRGLILRKRTVDTEQLETSKLLPTTRGNAMMPPLWFPNTVNNNVVRGTGLLVFCLSVVSCVAGGMDKDWGQYIAAGLFVDFALRLVAGSVVSPLGMLATVATIIWKPDFRPGPPKQFASFCGVLFSLLGTIFYFVDFDGHEIIGAIFMGMLAGA
jgi:glutaredoxin